jgi:hypothetical protein
MDFRTIATNLATAIGTITVGDDTATATARLPSSVGKLALLVYPPETDLSFLMGGPHLNAHLLFPVRLLRDPLDVPARTDALLDWMTALWPKPQANYDLNVVGVIETQATSIRGQIDGHEYSSVDGTFPKYDLVEMMVDVHVFELATFTP